MKGNLKAGLTTWLDVCQMEADRVSCWCSRNPKLIGTSIQVLFCDLFTCVFPLRLSFLSLDSTLRCKAALVFFWFHHAVLWILFCFIWTHRWFNLFIFNSSWKSFTYLVVSVFMSKVGSLLELTVKFWIPDSLCLKKAKSNLCANRSRCLLYRKNPSLQSLSFLLQSHPQLSARLA